MSLRFQVSGVRGQKSEDRSQRTEVRGQKSEDRRQMTEVRNQKSEDRSQKAEVRSRKAEDRRQRTEDRGQRSEDRGQKSEIRNQKSEVRSQRSESVLCHMCWTELNLWTGPDFFRTDKVASIAKKQKKSAFLADFRPLSEYARKFVAFFFMWD